MGVSDCTNDLVQKHFVRRHRKSPYSEFLILDNPSHARELAKKPECRLTKFGRSLKHSKRLSLKVLRARLLAIARRAHTNISQLEVSHATTRKIAHQRVQATRVSVEDLGAQNIGNQCSNAFPQIVCCSSWLLPAISQSGYTLEKV